MNTPRHARSAPSQQRSVVPASSGPVPAHQMTSYQPGAHRPEGTLAPWRSRSRQSATSLDAIERGDWARFERLLHADVHWTTAVEEDLRGRAAVLDRLMRDPPPAPPAYHELRDGLMVRWIDTPG